MDTSAAMTAGSASTLLAMLAGRAAQQPGGAAILAPGRSALNYRALHALVLRARSQLRAAGVAPHERVAVVLPNGPEMAAAFLGVACSAVCAPLNPLYKPAEFDFFLQDLAPRAVIVAAGEPSAARDAAARRGVQVIELSRRADQAAGEFDLAVPGGARPADAAEPASDDVCLILHTSGTTARPKMVPLSQANLCASARHIATALALTPADRSLNVMPLFHIHGLVGALLSSLDAGAGVICTPGFHAHEFFTWLVAERATWYTAVPTMHQAILARAAQSDMDASQAGLRFVRSSSAALPPQVMRELERVFRAPVVEAYGMTEASHQMASNPLPPRARKPGSVGVASGPQVAVIAEDGARMLGPGEIGEIAIRGANVSAGYLGNPEANQKAFAQGWFRTGDQGYIDADGYIFLTGRLKELINRGGEKISPREVDEVLLEHPAVAQAVTFGMPDAQLGEEVAAAVVLRDDGATERDLRKYAATRLAHFKVPRRILMLAELPKGATGKLQRIGLAQRLGLTEGRPVPEDAAPADSPVTDTERALGGIWGALLQVDEPGLTQRFRDLGGDSMTAMLLVAKIGAEFSVDVELIDLFDVPTIRGQARLIDEWRAAGKSAA